jgi:hypothetical protein
MHIEATGTDVRANTATSATHSLHLQLYIGFEVLHMSFDFGRLVETSKVV